jgi:hypothetical protein
MPGLWEYHHLTLCSCPGSLRILCAASFCPWSGSASAAAAIIATLP